MLGWIVLAAALALLAVVAVRTRRPPQAAVPGLDGFLGRWSDLHGGVDPRASVWLRGWLAIGYGIARPLARAGVQPDVVTVATAWLALGAVVLAAEGGRWLLLAGWLVVASGLADTLDGAVAALTDRASRWGYVLDSVVDRVTEVMFLVATWLVGAHPGVVVAAGGLGGLLEYVRARGRNAGGTEVGAITVGERASRVICCAIALFAAGVVPDRTAEVATASVALLALLGLVGLVHLLVAVHRDLRTGPDGATAGPDV